MEGKSPMQLQELVVELVSLIGVTNLPDFNLGFAATSGERLTLRTVSGNYVIENGVRDAHMIVQTSPEQLQALIALLHRGRTVSLVEAQQAIANLTVVPSPYKVFLVGALSSASGIPIDAAPYRPGTIPKPLRYPVSDNMFLMLHYTPTPLPAYDPTLLPALIADDHPEWVAMFEKAWQLAFGNLRQPEAASGFVSNFIDTAFNDNTFMYDSCFMTLFGHYGRRAFPFITTLDNFYAKQHADGFMCREINTFDGRDLFTPQDPSSTGPPIIAWAEWIHYERTRDLDRLRSVFPALVAYHLWWRDWRTWPDGSYFSDGWGSGLDNQTRVPESAHHHRHYRWADTSMQQALSCRLLQQMGDVIGRDEFNADLQREYGRLAAYINDRLWDEDTGFYYDLAPDGRLSTVKSIGMYWGLMADIIPDQRITRMLAHLDDPALFNRPHRVPSQAADSDGYDAHGGYWRGGIWSPTNYMVLCGLTHCGADSLAYAIARNHVENVAHVFTDTGTLWENYAPEYAGKGVPSRGDFVGWTGLSAISVPLEYLIGLRMGKARYELIWDIRLTEQHGVRRYPFSGSGTLDLLCAARPDATAPPNLTITTDFSLTLRANWTGGSQVWTLEPGSHFLTS